MAMYKIIHVDKSGIACDEQARLIAFARRATHDAEELLQGMKRQKPKPAIRSKVKAVTTNA